MTLPRLAIVGAGGHATRRIYPCIATAGARLVAVCDKDLSRSRRNAELFGGKTYADMGEMLEAEKLDAVIICIGPAEHAQLASIALRSGLPVYTEKPCAPTAADALAVARLAHQTGLLCTTAFKKRYNVAYNRAKEFVDSFDPQDLYSLSMDYASSQYANDSPKTLFLLDFAVHIIDLSAYLFGDAAEVFAFSKGPDAYAVSIKYANGAVGSLNLNDGRSFQIPTEEVEISIRGGNFMSIRNSSCWRIAQEGECTEWREPPTFTSAGDSGNETGHLAELVDFIEAVRQQRSTRSNIYESYKTMVLYEGIVQSAATGMPVKLSYEAL